MKHSMDLAISQRPGINHSSTWVSVWLQLSTSIPRLGFSRSILRREQGTLAKWQKLIRQKKKKKKLQPDITTYDAARK